MFDVFDHNLNFRRAFTLIELLVVMAIVAILAALLLPVVGTAKSKTQSTVCLNNLRQINLGLRMYCDDFNDRSPATRGVAFWSTSWSNYRTLMKSYVGLTGVPTNHDRLFSCPRDSFYIDLRPSKSSESWIPFLTHASLHDQTNFDYSSYAFNGGISNVFSLYTNTIGIGGRTLGSIKEPAKTVFVSEASALFPYSWHDPGNSSTFGAISFNNGAVLFDNAKNMVSFADGHVSYIKIYWNPGPTKPGTWAMAYQYNPPPGYDYKWSGD